MGRRDFLKHCLAATGLPFLAPLLERCNPIHQVQGTYAEGKLKVPRSAFSESERVLVRSQKSSFPVVVQRISDKEHRAIWLRCTHQGCKLNTGGGIYSCPCHGSSFSKDGRVLEGPAEKPLHTLQTETTDAEILVHLP